MRFSVSDTAEYGDMTRGPRIIDEHVREEMRRILEEIRDGRFAAEWVAEDRAGRPNYRALREQGKSHQIEQVGAELRAMMPFVSGGRQRLEDVSGG
jgi:ketol-acid reductoisomerase